MKKMLFNFVVVLIIRVQASRECRQSAYIKYAIRSTFRVSQFMHSVRAHYDATQLTRRTRLNNGC